MRSLQRQFMDFLHNEVDAYDEFAHNLWKERKMTFIEFLESESPEHWVGGGFVYPNDTSDYWEIIDKKWRLELLKEKI